MKVVGFTIVKDAIKYDYPYLESIKSILPICDEFIVGVGKSSDDTLEQIRNIPDKKIKILETVWDENVRKGGHVLAIETNKVLAEIPKDADWNFYIQADEVMHEKYLDVIHEEMKKNLDNPKVDALLFKYLHFYGSYEYVGNSSKWYSHEIRAFKNNPSVFSFRDAQGFRKGKNKLMRAKEVDVWVYHYGWVKHPKEMQKKQEHFNKYWHDDEWMEENVVKADEYDYKNIDSLRLFDGTHPAVMKERLEKKNWAFEYDFTRNKKTRKEMIKQILKNYLGMDTSYKNYIKVKK